MSKVSDNILEILRNSSPEEIERILAMTKKQIRNITIKEEQIQSDEVKATLKPLQEAVDKAEQGVKKVREAFDEQINKLKEARNKALEDARGREQAARNELNKVRQELGLKATRKVALGPQMQWHVEVNVRNTPIIATVGPIGEPEKHIEIEVSEEGKVDIKVLREKLFVEKSIEDPGGGKLRGLMTRIKLKYINELDKEEGREVISGK